MNETARSTTVTRPAEQVWQQLADFGEISRWASSVDHSCLLRDAPGTVGVGTVRRVQLGRRTLLERVVAWQPPTLLSYEIQGLPPVVRGARTTWVVEPTGEDRTLVTVVNRLEGGPLPPQRLAATVLARVMARASQQLLEALAEHPHPRPDARSHLGAST